MASQKFEGWLGVDKDAAKGNMQWGTFEPKKWQKTMLTLRSLIAACAAVICIRYPLAGDELRSVTCVVGHEMVGKAVRVGSNVKHVKVGDRVGVGAQARSCLQESCADCGSGLENHCAVNIVGTYGSIYPNDEGKSYGGYADYNRTNGHFVFKIPGGLSSADAAPLLCGGITVFSPLKANKCGPRKAVGIVGVGGLGRFAVLFAKGLGADRVVGSSRRGDKRSDAFALGANEYIATSEDADWASKNKRTLDLIICTVSSKRMPLTDYLGLLKAKGTFIQVGLPDGGSLPPVNAFTLIANGIKVGGSTVGAPREIEEMIQLAADAGIKPWVQERPLRDANQVLLDFEDGKARYRYVLVNEKHTQM